MKIAILVSICTSTSRPSYRTTVARGHSFINQKRSPGHLPKALSRSCQSRIRGGVEASSKRASKLSHGVLTYPCPDPGKFISQRDSKCPTNKLESRLELPAYNLYCFNFSLGSSSDVECVGWWSRAGTKNHSSTTQPRFLDNIRVQDMWE